MDDYKKGGRLRHKSGLSHWAKQVLRLCLLILQVMS